MAPHILIIEPDTSAAHITAAGVERIVPGASLTVEPSPEQGLRSIEQQCPDIAIIDPPSHSLATGRLIHQIKRIYPQAQVIVLASAPTPALRRNLQKLGADAYLAKPTPLTALMDAVRTAVETLRLHHDPEQAQAAAVNDRHAPDTVLAHYEQSVADLHVGVGEFTD